MKTPSTFERMALGLFLAAVALVLAHAASGCKGPNSGIHECATACKPRAMVRSQNMGCVPGLLGVTTDCECEASK